MEDQLPSVPSQPSPPTVPPLPPTPLAPVIPPAVSAHNSPRSTPVDPDIEKTFQEVLNKTVYPTSAQTPEQQQHFLSQYSWSALILNFIYYEAMGDQLLAWTSAIASLTVVLIPVLFILPIWARARAYRGKRRWQSFGQFEANQKSWDKISWYSLIIVVILFFALVRYLGPSLLKDFQQVSSLTSQTASSDQSAAQQIQQAKNGLQQELGQ